MKRALLILFLLLFMVSPTAQALDWAYHFVVWNGKVYEVKQQEIVDESMIGKKIGKVTTKANDNNGKYFGNASNYSKLGTRYYEIIGTSTSESIAVENEKGWVRAVYIHKAPFHIMNVVSNLYFIVSVVMLLIIFVVGFRRNKLKRQ